MPLYIADVASERAVELRAAALANGRSVPEEIGDRLERLAELEATSSEDRRLSLLRVDEQFLREFGHGR